MVVLRMILVTLEKLEVTFVFLKPLCPFATFFYIHDGALVE